VVVLPEAPRDLAHGQGFGRIRLPLLEMPVTQIILVVEEQLLQTGAGDIDQAQFGLGRGARSATALGKVLTAAAGGLYHLIHRAGTGIKEFLAEPVGRIIDQRRGLETARPAIATAGPQPAEARGGVIGRIGRI